MESTLSYLYALADGDTGFVIEILDLMYKNIPIDIDHIENALKNDDLASVKRNAHHMKSSIQYSDYIELSDLLSVFENTQDSPTAIADITSLLPQLKQLSHNLIQVIEAEKKKID
ncbi:MAG TPA: Hpt domain-containing protein [Bacteroidia bacterium]|jgi:HPt (histidine-containing phosphotransfer) domain-containing protein|nr:Hpt domain-containing protein [Bacteroidia bacterium]